MKKLNQYILEKFKLSKKNYYNEDTQELIAFFHSTYNDESLDEHINKWINKYNPTSFTFYFPDDRQLEAFEYRIKKLNLKFENSSLVNLNDSIEFVKIEGEVLDNLLRTWPQEAVNVERDNLTYSNRKVKLFIGKCPQKGIVISDSNYWIVIYINN